MNAISKPSSALITDVIAQCLIKKIDDTGLVSGQAEDGHAPAVTLLSERTHWQGDPSDLRFEHSQLRGLVSLPDW